MANAQSENLRSRVLEPLAKAMSVQLVAACFAVGMSSAIRWIARAKISEQPPRPQGDKLKTGALYG